MAVVLGVAGIILLSIGANGYQPAEVSTRGWLAPAVLMCIAGFAAVISGFFLFAVAPRSRDERR